MEGLRILVLVSLAVGSVRAEGELITACLFSRNCEFLKDATLLETLFDELSGLYSYSATAGFVGVLNDLARCRRTMETGCDAKIVERDRCEEACIFMNGIKDGDRAGKIWRDIRMSRLQKKKQLMKQG